MESRAISFERGAHFCHLFEGTYDQKAVALPFLLEGLRRGDACLYVTGSQTVDDWLFEFQASGINVEVERQRKALNVTTGAAFRHPIAEFNSIVKAGELLEFIEDRLKDFKAVRITGDVAWESDPPLPADKVCHWEATANLVLVDLDVHAICQYDLGTESPTVIHSALRTHPRVILGLRLYSNPFYEAPLILENEPYLNRSDADATRIESMLAQIKSHPYPYRE